MELKSLSVILPQCGAGNGTPGVGWQGPAYQCFLLVRCEGDGLPSTWHLCHLEGGGLCPPSVFGLHSKDCNVVVLDEKK